MNNKDIVESIINTIKRNRISTVEVADCLGKSGLFAEAKPTQRGWHKVGQIHWVYAAYNSNWTIHEQVQNVSKGNIVMIEAYQCEDRAMIGALVSKYILLYQQAEAIISNQLFRDLNDINKENYPIWCKGYTPIGCFNVKPECVPPKEWLDEHKNKYHKAIAVCDDNGVVVIPKECHNEEFLQKLSWIEEQEDIWFDCLDRKKMNTFDIVCLKRYME